MIYIYIILIIILLIFIPIPLKIEIKLHEKVFNIKVFKFDVFSSNKKVKNKFIEKIVENAKHQSEKAELKKKAKKIKHKISFSKLYNNISKNKFKPSLKIYGDLEFGLEDSLHCAVLYGMLCNTPAVLNGILNKIFSIKRLNLNITPKFNTFSLSFLITSIFYLNIANIIYILYLISKSLEIND